MAAFEASFQETLVFTNSEPLAIKDVISSLKALERVSSAFLPSTLSRLTNTEVLSVEVLVSGFEQGSFKENIFYRLVFANEKSMIRFLDHVRDWNVRAAYRELSHGVGNAMPSNTKHTVILTTVVIILVGTGLYTATCLMGGDEDTKSLINGNNNVVIAIGADAFGKSPEEVQQIVSDAIGPNQKKLAQDAANFVAPTRGQPGSSIQVQGASEDVAIPSDVVQKAPVDVVLDPLEQEEVYKDVDLQIRATDLDSVNRGWAGLIPGLVERRVKLLVSEGIDSTALAGKFSVRADVKVLYRMDDRQKKFRATQITLLEIIEEQ